MTSSPIKSIHGQRLKAVTLFVLRLVFTFCGAIILFTVVPAIQHFSKDVTLEKKAIHEKKVVIIKQKITKKVQPKEKPQKIRQTSTAVGKRTANALSMKFTPDLGIDGSGVAIGSGGGVESIIEEGEADEPPIPLKRSPIPYPKAAKNAGIEGVINVRYVIDREGHVSNVEFLKIPHRIFKSPVQHAILRWKFKPARMKGVPVSIRARQTITFTLDD